MNIAELKTLLSEKTVLTDPAELKAYAVEGLVPLAVARPVSSDEISALLKMANERGWALAPLGGGTSLALGSAPKKLDLVLSTERLNRIIDIDTANLTVTVQAGVNLSDLQALLAGHENRCFFPVDSGLKEQADSLCSDRDYKGVFLPLDPAGSGQASLGGILAANAAGPLRHRYGQARDLVLGLRFVQPDGGIIGLGGKTVKNVSGYDQGKLLIGSLGSLGVITEATLRLLPLAPKAAGFSAVFKNLAGVTALSQALLDSKLLPSTLELISGPIPGLDLEAGHWALASLLEGTAEEVERQLNDLETMANQAGAVTTQRQTGDAARKLSATLADGPDLAQPAAQLKGFFPLAAWPQIAAAWAKELAGFPGPKSIQARPGLGLAWAHLGDLDGQTLPNITQTLRAATTEAGGGLVVESAPPDLKIDLDIWGPPGSDWPIMAGLKKRFDPNNILNPGRFVGGL